jgi:hypothetical protein
MCNYTSVVGKLFVHIHHCSLKAPRTIQAKKIKSKYFRTIKKKSALLPQEAIVHGYFMKHLHVNLYMALR